MTRSHRRSFHVELLAMAALIGVLGLSGVSMGDGFVAAAQQSPSAGIEANVGNDWAPKEESILGVNWTIERFERVEHPRRNAAYRITNHFGDLRLRGSDGDELMVVGASQYSTTDHVRPMVEIRESDDGMTVDVRFPNPDATQPDLASAEIGKRRVDLAVIIPGLGPVDVDSLSGLVDARGLLGPLTVHSQSGTLRVVARNSLDLHSVHGDVDVHFEDGETVPALAVETLTGDVRVELPVGIDRTIRAETNGYLTTDFSLSIDKKVGSARKVAHVALGKGGDIIRLTSNLGMISILEERQLMPAASP